MGFWLESIFQRAQGVCKSSLVVVPQFPKAYLTANQPLLPNPFKQE